MLNQLFQQFRLSTTVFHRSLVCDNWQTDTSGSGNLNFHFVFQGDCYLHLPDGTVQTLHQGDFVLFPTDGAHRLTAIADLEQLDTSCPQFQAFSVHEQLPNSTGLACGFFALNDDRHQVLMQALPECVICRQTDADASLKIALDLLLTEAVSGKELAVLARCAEMFFVLLLRQLLSGNAAQIKLLSALQHPRLGPVLTALYADPGAPWSVDRMAELACMSRSAFFDHFRQLLDEPPQTYLTRLRLQHAKQLLQQGMSVTAVSEQAGYQAEEAFAKAFKRQFGYGPGQARKRS